ncbi:cation-translocating P-type ATPase [Deltaproteobacteria bacterium PRO3]|nr:cation-translocating P-type ATPase [Deltaproteobacteria bacterium PRO3]
MGRLAFPDLADPLGDPLGLRDLAEFSSPGSGGDVNPEVVQHPASPPWHTWTAEAVLGHLRSDRRGLSEEEAARRLARYGWNELKEGKPVKPLKIFLGQFSSLIVWILIAAGLVSGLLQEWADSIAIFSIVLLNGILGFYQEYSAEKSIAALKKMTAPHAKVRRGGELRVLPAREVVPGDILELEAGDLVPADARLLEADSLQSLEAALTGESEPVRKSVAALGAAEVPLGDRKNLLYMGTSISAGAGRAVVVATGMKTEFGRIAGLLQQAAFEEGTPLQKRLQAVGRVLVWASLGIVAVLFLLGYLRGLNPFDLFLTSVSMAVAAVPEGLPAVVTIGLALGVQRMSRRRALIRKLPAVETLGSTNVICTDKTGTLTVGEMTVREIYVGSVAFAVSGEGYGPEGEILLEGRPPGVGQEALIRRLLTVMTGCNEAHLIHEKDRWQAVGDPTEAALLAAARKAGVEQDAVERDFPKLRAFPFDSERKRMSVLRETPGGVPEAMVKGAPDILLALCTHILDEGGLRPIEASDRERLTKQIDAMAERALRVLAAAYRPLEARGFEGLSWEDVESRLVFLGLVGMYDPPRAEAKEAVAKCRSAGIRVVMITGDHPHTALAIARELGIAAEDAKALSGAELDGLSDRELQARVAEIAVYARVSAEHKLRVVRAWKAVGAVIAMTGDGVNDAPAIKGADIGIAMGITGTEVTKEASDMVVTDDNFASIVAAVEEGRGVYDNIKKTLQYLLAGNVGELLLMTTAVLLGLPLPLLPIHLLWINLVTDGLPALCLATDPIDPDVMRRPPRRREAAMTDRAFLYWTLFPGLLTAAIALGVYGYVLRAEGLETARTAAFAVLVYAEMLKSFAFRNERKPFWQVGIFSNARLFAVVTLSVVFQPWAHHVEFLERFFKISAISWRECLLLVAIGAVPLAVIESVKMLKHWFSTRRYACVHS